MFYKRKDTQREKAVQQAKNENAFRIPQQGLLYHYAGIETIWKILESDFFLARNIRFSNDSEEYRLGEKKIREYTKGWFKDKKQRNEFDVKLQQKIGMFYMICFCGKGDLLSQWRGYARDGASLGMDFLEEDSSQEHTEIFTILNNEKNQENGRCKLDDEYVKFVEMPYQVFYVESEEDKDNDSDNDKVKEAIHSFDKKDKDARTNLLLDMIPLIKDIGFKEEAEYRILFDMSDLGKTEAQNRKIRSRKIRYMEKDNCKLPNIAVEVGDSEKKEKGVTEVILGTEIKTRALQRELAENDIESIYGEIEEEIAKTAGSACTFERPEEKKYIYISEGNNQEDIMACIEDVLQRNDFSTDCENGIKIWCRGHLPIREIIVGPGEKREKLKESLKHYIQNVYWLRYVDVKDSAIPLQN